MLARLIAIVVIVFLALPCFAAKKRDWQEGKLIKVETVSAGVGGVAVGMVLMGVNIPQRNYSIETEKAVYVLGTERDLKLTLGSTVKFAVEGKKAYVMEKTKERTLLVVGGTIKPEK